MESEAVTDSQVSASSQLDGQHSAAKARLHFKTDENKDGGWSSHTSDPNQWLQVDFRSYATVARIATQGRHAHNEWVVNYKLNYSDDGVTFQTCRVPGTNISKVLLCPEKWLSFTLFCKSKELEPKCVPQLFLGWRLGTRRSATDQFFSLSLITIPELFAKPIFFLFFKWRIASL